MLVLEKREKSDSFFCEAARTYSSLHRFETVDDSDPYVEVRAEGHDKEFLAAQGVSVTVYERQLLALVFLSQAPKPDVEQERFHRSTSPRLCWQESIDW